MVGKSGSERQNVVGRHPIDQCGNLEHGIGSRSVRFRHWLELPFPKVSP